MNNMQRIYQIDQILGARHCVTRKELLERLGVSWATLKRDLAYMRDRLNAPIRFDRNLGGYRFEKAGQRVGAHYELPGLWFSAEEIHALLTMHHLLSNLDTGGLLGPQIRPLLARLTGLLGSADNPAEEVQRRIRIQTVGARELHLDHFQSVGSALLRRKRLLIRYHARGTDEVTEREVSPQRLNHHRGNWYLDARCHLRDGLRAFSVDAIEHAEILDTRALDVADERLDEVLGSGYGVFSGECIAWAVLRFTPERARWVATERWHQDQEGAFVADGSYELRVPYADDRELVMDIMKYGSDCEVVGPEALRVRVAAEFAAALARYGNQDRPGNRGRANPRLHAAVSAEPPRLAVRAAFHPTSSGLARAVKCPWGSSRPCSTGTALCSSAPALPLRRSARGVYVVSCGNGVGGGASRVRRCQGRTKSGRSRTLDIVVPSPTLPPGRWWQAATIGLEDNSGLSLVSG